MAKKGILTKILAVLGTALAWFPILAPVLFAVFRYIQSGRILIDYLMPAELFPVALVGSLLLLWAALRAHSQLRPIGWGLGGAVGLLVGTQALAVVTGLASGATEPGGWPWAIVIAGLAGYVLALVLIAVGGSLLVKDVFAPAQLSAA